jgi:hypothetical protein
VLGGWWIIGGLLLQRTGIEEDEYSRFGVFGLSKEAASLMFGMDVDKPKILESLMSAMEK